MYKWKASVLLSVIVFLFTTGCTKKEELLTYQNQNEVVAMEASQLEEEVFSENETKQTEAVINESSQKEPSEAIASKEETFLYVHICGAVLKPDVYRLKEGDRIFHVVEAAGGFLEDADQSYVNQALEVKDGMKITIPTLKETEQMVKEGGESAKEPGVDQPGVEVLSEDATETKININTANQSSLCMIPGIGATRADAIIAYREKNGGFQKKEDIMNVEGIKEGTYQKIKDVITVQ